MRRRAAGLAAVAALAGIAAAQQPVFEAAVLRLNTSGDVGTSVGQRPGGQYIMTNGPIALLLVNAYQPENRTIVGLPDWAGSERYDLIARANATTSSDDMRLMLRALLADRLKLRVRLEAREEPVYFLVPARPDRTLGPAIERTSRDCASVAAADRAGLPRPVLAPPANGAPPCGFNARPGELVGGGQTMDGLARNFGARAGRPVFNRAGIDGYFDVKLTWAPDQTAPGDEPSFFTALQEQLGLKLESGRAPLRTLIVDHIERPSEN